MSNVAVEKVREADATLTPLFSRMAALADTVRQRAYEIFKCRGGGDGHSVEDWLQAEGDIIQPSEAEVIEKDGKFQARVAIPGFDLKDIRVTAMPTALYIEAEAKHEHEEKNGEVRLREFGQKQIFRRLDLASPINVDRVTAALDHGILQIIAPRATETKETKKEIKSLAAS